MKLILLQQELMAALALCEKVLDKNSPPLSDTIRLTAELDGECVIEAKSTTESVRVVCKIEDRDGLKGGSVCLSCQALKRLGKELGGGQIQLEVTKKNTVALTQILGKRRFNLSAFEFEFPVLDRPTDLKEFDASVFKSAISKVKHAACKDISRPQIAGVHVDITGGKAEATDGHRHSRTDDMTGSYVIIPEKSIKTIEALCSCVSMIQVEKDRIFLSSAGGGVEYVGLTSRAKFPAISYGVPAVDFVVVREHLVSALTALSISSDQFKCVNVSVASGLIKLETKGEISQGYDEVICSYDNKKPVELKINIAYLLDALASCDGEDVTLSLGDGYVIITDGDYKEIICCRI